VDCDARRKGGAVMFYKSPEMVAMLARNSRRGERFSDMLDMSMDDRD
jgi:hypothetical protein